MAKKEKWQKAGVVFQPQTYQGLQRGINQIADAIAPTLGPFPRTVMYDRSVGSSGRLPELLDDGGTIARRIIQIPGRDADMGAMLLRHMLWQMHEKVGDGTATAAVLFRALYNEGVRYLAAGGNAMRLRGYLEAGMRLMLDILSGMTTYLEGQRALAQLAYTICYDKELADMLGEIFDIIGEYGRLELRTANSWVMEREYVEGMYWEGGILSRTMINNTEHQRAELENPAILMTDFDVEDPRDLVPALGICVKLGIERLLVIARKLSEPVIGLLQLNKREGRINVEVVGAKTPGVGASVQRDALTDLAILTGGRALLKDAGDSLRNIAPKDLGRARRVWVDKQHVGIIGAKGDPRQVRMHIAELRTAFKNLSVSGDRTKLQQRIGKLMGGSATLWIPGMTKTEQEFNKELAKRTGEAMRGAMRDGVVPGGGVALLACRPALKARVSQSTDVDERAAYQILYRALDAPLRTLLRNAGHEPGQIMAEIERAGLGYGFDIRSHAIVDMMEVGIYDAATVIHTAVHNAISTAALALTTDVLVHRSDAPNALTT